MSTPKRIQRKRTKGWRMPEGALYVGRPTKWGNPYHVGGSASQFSRALSVAYFRDRRSDALAPPAILQLRGKDLACWCPLDQPCHADVLLEWANA